MKRVLELMALALMILAAFAAGAWFDPWAPSKPKPLAPGRPPATLLPIDKYRVSEGIPRPGTTVPDDPRQPEERAVALRADVIRRDAAAIRDECQRAAGGDWKKWQENTAPYRNALKARLDALKDLPESSRARIEEQYEALEGRDGFPLFEVGARFHLNYLYDPTLVQPFRRERPVVAAARWLKKQGIDLIFVAAPKMTEVYVEHFIDPSPPDGIIAPHIRRTLLELLDADVEVVDGWRIFRPFRDTDTEYLYNTADAHWAPRGMRIMAKEIADRIERYKFGARARYGMPLFQTSPGPHLVENVIGGIGATGGWNALSPEQKKRATSAQTTTSANVSFQKEWATENYATSPVVVIGNSYVKHFSEQLAKEMNLPPQNHAYDLQTTEEFAQFLREPGFLSRCRVLVWVINNQYLTSFKPLPKPIIETLLSDDQHL